MNRTLSRREKKKPTDGVTLTGINQTGDQALQNKPSRWVWAASIPGPSAWARTPARSLGTWVCPQWGFAGSPLGLCPDAPWASEFGEFCGRGLRAPLGGSSVQRCWSCRRIRVGALATTCFGPQVKGEADRCWSCVSQGCPQAGGGHIISFGLLQASGQVCISPRLYAGTWGCGGRIVRCPLSEITSWLILIVWVEEVALRS